MASIKLQSSNHKLEDFVPYAKPRSRRSHIFGIIIQSLIGIISIGYIALLTLFGVSQHIYLYLPISLVVGLTVIYLMKTAKRYLINTPQKLMAESRMPILYLRSFRHDTEIVDTQSWEETLVGALDEIGLVCAVGMPGEDLPRLGAARLYFKDDEWREKVEDLMEISRFVVLSAGSSAGLEWEMRLAIKKLRPEQLIYTFGNWRKLKKSECEAAYKTFKEHTERIFNTVMPEKINIDDFLCFQGNWDARVLHMPLGKKIIHGLWSSDYVKEVLKPVMKEQGLKFKWIGSAAWMAGFFALVFILIFILFQEIASRL